MRYHTGYSARQVMDHDESLDFLSELPEGNYWTESWIKPRSGSTPRSYDKIVEELDNSRSVSSEIYVQLEYRESQMGMYIIPKADSLSELPKVGAKAVFDLDNGFEEFKEILEGRDWK